MKWWGAMRRPIVVPPVGPARVRLSVWFVRPGDSVYAGDRLVELLVDDATFDVSSPADGRLAEKSAQPGDALTPGQTVGYLEAEDAEA